MKKSFLIAALCIASLFSTVYAGENDEYYWEPPRGVVRGLVNMATSPAELVRGWWYWSQYTFGDHPWLLGLDGFVWGTCSGTLWTLGRFGTGFADLVCGLAGNWLHCDYFPTWVWQDEWNPKSLDD